MATSKQVQSALKRFTNKLDRANDDIKDLTKTIAELEKVLETYNAMKI